MKQIKISFNEIIKIFSYQFLVVLLNICVGQYYNLTHNEDIEQEIIYNTRNYPSHL